MGAGVCEYLTFCMHVVRGRERDCKSFTYFKDSKNNRAAEEAEKDNVSKNSEYSTDKWVEVKLRHPTFQPPVVNRPQGVLRATNLPLRYN